MLSSIVFLFPPSIAHHFSCKKHTKAEISNLYEVKLTLSEQRAKMNGWNLTMTHKAEDNRQKKGRVSFSSQDQVREKADLLLYCLHFICHQPFRLQVIRNLVYVLQT